MTRHARSTTTTGPLRITPALTLALYEFTANVKRARDEYRAHPIISEPHCENCGIRSAAALCQTCEDAA